MNLDIVQELATKFKLPIMTIQAAIDSQAKLICKAMHEGKETGNCKKVRCPHLGTFSADIDRLDIVKNGKTGVSLKPRK